MAKAQRPDPSSEAAPNPDDVQGEEAQALEIYEALERAKSETGPGRAVKIILFKKREDSTQWDRVRAFPAAEFDFDRVPVMFGGGEYIVQLMSATGYIRGGRLPVSYSTDVYPRTPAPQVAAAAVGAAMPVDRTGELMALMQQQARAADERYVGLLQTFLQSMTANLKPPSTADRLAELKLLHELVAPATAPRELTPVQALADAFRSGMNASIGKKGADDDDDDEEGGASMVRVIEKGLDTFARILEARRPAGAAPAPGAPAPGARPRAAAPPLPDHLAQYAWLRKYVPQAMGYAQQGVSAKRVAGAIYEMVPDEQLGQLEDFARMDTGQRRQILAQLDGRLSPYMSYLDEVVVELIARFDAEPEDGPEDGPGDDEPEDEDDADGTGAAQS